MSKKDIKKIIIPAIAIIVIIGGLVVYFVKPQEVQPVMAPLETEQDLVEEKEEIPEEPQEDTVTDNNEVEIATDSSINSTYTDIELGDDEYKGDNGADALQGEYDSLSEEEQEMVDQIAEDIIKNHPEWFGGDSTGNTGNNKAPGYVSVDAPVDNGVIPEYTVGESGGEGLSQNVTVY